MSKSAEGQHLKLIFEEIKDKKEFDRLFLEMTSDIPKNSSVVMAYPEISHPSALLSNFSVRDDSKIIAAFKHEQLAGLSSFIQSKASFLPTSFLNRIFFFLTRGQVKSIEDSLIQKVESAYSMLQIPEVSYMRLHPLEEMSPSGRRLGKHEYKKRFSMKRMARKLENIPKTRGALLLRRVEWKEEDLLIFMKTWAKGFGWPAERIEKIAYGMTSRLLERNSCDPDTWINFLAETDGQTVGTAATLTFPDSAYVVNVSTLKEFRRQGFATCTMINLMKWCRTRGMKYMTLDVGPHDKAAMNLYRGLGFEEFGESAGYVKKL
jgi:ribosomal protein S18 acetylase RimI-like enzyme